MAVSEIYFWRDNASVKRITTEKGKVSFVFETFAAGTVGSSREKTQRQALDEAFSQAEFDKADEPDEFTKCKRRQGANLFLACVAVSTDEELDRILSPEQKKQAQRILTEDIQVQEFRATRGMSKPQSSIVGLEVPDAGKVPVPGLGQEVK